jgi:conjugative transfer signal peptidase TraF
MTRLATMLATVLSSGTLGTSAFVDLPMTVIWNASASAPIGLYFLQADGSVDVTDLVAIMPPPPMAEFMAVRGYLPIGVPILKRILAQSGQTVCRQGLDIIVYGATVGRARERDSAGRKMPVWQGCPTVGDDEFFVMNWDVPDSVDSRYFGPLPRASVIGRARPVWTDEAGDGLFTWWAKTR